MRQLTEAEIAERKEYVVSLSEGKRRMLEERVGMRNMIKRMSAQIKECERNIDTCLVEIDSGETCEEQATLPMEG